MQNTLIYTHKHTKYKAHTKHKANINTSLFTYEITRNIC